MNPILSRIGGALARWLTQPRHQHGVARPTPVALLASALRPGDVLLVEGDTRVSVAIKYLTQSTWSHAALFVGAPPQLGGAGDWLVEADLVEGVRSVPLAAFTQYPTRICRPVGLAQADRDALTNFALHAIGHRYDLKNVIDLARYLLPTPPVPTRWRRRMIALGSGDPTRAICSSLIAAAFQSIGYPILPIQAGDGADCPDCAAERAQVRHHSLFTPRDFDVSPYFQVVKPTLEAGFDFHRFAWAE